MQITFITRQRIILIWLLIIAFLLTLIRHWARYILIVPVGLIAAFTLLTIIFPLYQQWPNFVDFYKAQESKIFFTTQTTSKILIQNNTTKQELDGQKNTQQNLPKNLETKISLVASSQTGDENAYILLPEWSTIQLRPQSQITFLSQYPKIVITKTQWEIAKLPSDNYSPWQIILSWVAEQDGLKNQYQQTFEKEKTKAIGSQINSIFMQNAVLKSINKGVLDILTRLRPVSFQDNIKNFNDFEIFLPIQKRRQTDTTVDPAIQQEVINQAARWVEDTQLYQRWKKIFQK